MFEEMFIVFDFYSCSLYLWAVVSYIYFMFRWWNKLMKSKLLSTLFGCSSLALWCCLPISLILWINRITHRIVVKCNAERDVHYCKHRPFMKQVMTWQRCQRCHSSQILLWTEIRSNMQNADTTIPSNFIIIILLCCVTLTPLNSHLCGNLLMIALQKLQNLHSANCTLFSSTKRLLHYSDKFSI